MVWISLSLFIVVGLGGAYYYQQRTELASRAGEATAGEVPPTAEPVAPRQAQALQVPSQPEEQVVDHPVQGGQSAARGETAAAARPESSRVAAPQTTRNAARITADDDAGAAAPRVGDVIVTANLDGARISIDGRSRAGWVTPQTIQDLSSGTHQVTVSKDGYEPVSALLVVRPGQTASLRAELYAPGGEINIATNPPGLPVSIDGGPFTASPAQAVVKAGRHSYRVRLPDSRIYEGSFEMKNGSIITRRVDFVGGDWLSPEPTP